MPKYRVKIERVTTTTEHATVEVEAKNSRDASFHAHATEHEWAKVSENAATTIVEAKPAKGAAE